MKFVRAIGVVLRRRVAAYTLERHFRICPWIVFGGMLQSVDAGDVRRLGQTACELVEQPYTTRVGVREPMLWRRAA